MYLHMHVLLHLISALLDVVIVVVVHRGAVHVQVAVVPRLLHVDQQLPPIVTIVDNLMWKLTTASDSDSDNDNEHIITIVDNYNALKWVSGGGRNLETNLSV